MVRGAAGDLYGASALGGVIQVLTFDPGQPMVRATLDGGSHETVRFSTFAGGRTNAWSYQASAEFLETKGVVIVTEKKLDPTCCAVDVEAFSDYQSGFAGFGYTAPSWRGRFRGSVYNEKRGNGTPVQVNDTQWRNVSGDLTGTAQNGVWTVNVDGGTQSYFQTFSAVIANRNDERLVRRNEGPTEFFNISGQWVQTLGDYVLLVGGEGKRVEGIVNSTGVSFGTGLPTGTAQLGGIEKSGAVFTQVSLGVNDRTTVSLGARGDFWRSDPVQTTDPKHSSNFFSPRAAVAFRVRDDVSLQALAYRSWRSPTLNELFRGFQVGSIVTNANALLAPERLTGRRGAASCSHGATSRPVSPASSIISTTRWRTSPLPSTRANVRMPAKSERRGWRSKLMSAHIRRSAWGRSPCSPARSSAARRCSPPSMETACHKCRSGSWAAPLPTRTHNISRRRCRYAAWATSSTTISTSSSLARSASQMSL